MNSELCNQKICKVLTANFDCNSNNLSTKSAFQITKYNVKKDMIYFLNVL